MLSMHGSVREGGLVDPDAPIYSIECVTIYTMRTAPTLAIATPSANCATLSGVSD